MPTCTLCKTDKPATEFYSRVSGKPYPQCKDCHKKYVRAAYHRDKPAGRDRVKQQRQKLVEWFRDYKRGLKCSRCPENHWACIEFHHKDPKTKEFSIVRAIARRLSIKRILAEIEKCEVLCANCHRKLHHPI